MKLDIYSSLSSQRALPHRQSACAGRFLRFFCRHGDKAPLFCFVRRMISALSPGGSFLRRASPLPYTSATPRRAPLPLRPLRTVPCGEAGAASASPFPWRAFSPMYAAPRTSPLHRPSGLRLAGRQERPPAIPLPWRRAFSPMPAPRLLSMHAAPRTRSSLRPLRAVPYRAAGSASRNPVSAARLRSPLRPFGLRLTGRQERPPQARFHGALPLPCMPRRAPLPLHCPFGLCLTGRQERPPAIPFLRRAFSPCTSAPRTRSPMRPLRTVPAKRQERPPQARFHGAPSPPCTHVPRLPFPLRPLRAVPCEAARAASRKPASVFPRFPSLACRAAHPFSHASPSDCALRGSRSGLPQARFHGALPLPCTSAPRTRSSLHCPFGLCLAKRQERPPASPLPWHASAPLHAAPRTSPPASPSGCALQGGRSGLRKPASMARLPPMHAAPRTRSSRGTPCPGRFAAPVRKLLFQAAPAGKSGLRVHSVQIQSLRIQQIA